MVEHTHLSPTHRRPGKASGDSKATGEILVGEWSQLHTPKPHFMHNLALVRPAEVDSMVRLHAAGV